MNYMFYPVKRRVVVNTQTDRAFRGILWRRAFRYLVLKDAELLKKTGEAMPLDGEIVILRENVDFLQVL